MKSSPRSPIIATRNRQEIASALADNRAGYTPKWTTPLGAGDAGMALNGILARYLEIQGDGLNAMPGRMQLEFLESLGANVLPPQPARAPLVFKLLDTASDDATVPKGTRVAAVLPPPAPSSKAMRLRSARRRNSLPIRKSPPCAATSRAYIPLGFFRVSISPIGAGANQLGW